MEAEITRCTLGIPYSIQDTHWNVTLQLVYGKTCHLLVELEHRAHWAIQKWNMDLKLAGEYRRRQITELEEWRHRAYHSASIYKERTKRWHDKQLKPKNFNPRDKGITLKF